MMNEQTRIDILKSENYSAQSGLTHRNRKLVYKMFKYIHKTPLKEYEVEQMHKDIIGMAAEAEQREESFEQVMGGNWKKFCDQLIKEMTDYSLPKGWRCLRIAGAYFLIKGYYMLGTNLFTLLTLVPLAVTGQLGGFAGVLQSIVTWVVVLAMAILYKMAGDRAREYSIHASHANICEKWGYIVFLLQIFGMIYTELTIFWMSGERIHLLKLPAARFSFIYILELLFHGFWIWLYICGARKNKT